MNGLPDGPGRGFPPAREYRCRRWFLVPAHFHGDDELDGLLEGGHHLLGEKTHAPLHGLFRQQAAGVEFGGETRQT